MENEKNNNKRCDFLEYYLIASVLVMLAGKGAFIADAEMISEREQF